jgi:hypothetical protein
MAMYSPVRGTFPQYEVLTSCTLKCLSSNSCYCSELIAVGVGVDDRRREIELQRPSGERLGAAEQLESIDVESWVQRLQLRGQSCHVRIAVHVGGHHERSDVAQGQLRCEVAKRKARS